MKRLLSMTTCFLMFFLCCFLRINAAESFQLSYYDPTDQITYTTFLGNDGTYYLYLPNGTNTQEIICDSSISLNEANCSLRDDHTLLVNQSSLTLQDTKNNEYHVEVLTSSLPAVSMQLNDITLSTINNGDKSIKYIENSIIIKQEGLNPITSSMLEVKGRGNFTWKLSKKAYQIKFDTKVNVLGLGKAKTWILLANHADGSLLRNQIAFDFANSMNIPFGIQYAPVDLWVDGNYIGSYLLTEKVQVAANRVELIDPYGVLCELDNSYYPDEDLYASSLISNTHFTLKDSVADDLDKDQSISKEAFEHFMELINNFEKALYNHDSWENVSQYLDIDSVIKMYFLQEFSEDPDGCRSSFYLYQDGINDVIHFGPAWDYDSSLGNYQKESLGGNPEVDYVSHITSYMENSNDWYAQLLKYPEFKEQLFHFYQETLQPYLHTIPTSIDQKKEIILQSANMNFQLWNVLGNQSVFGSNGHPYEATYDQEVDYLKNWIITRSEYLDSRYTEEFLNNNHTIVYSTHSINQDWNEEVSDGITSNSLDQSLDLLKISLENTKYSGSIVYSVHSSDIGWINDYSEGKVIGSNNKQIECVKMHLTGELANQYSIAYRVYVKSNGWTDWKLDGKEAGTTGKCLPIQGIEIKLVDHEEKEINYTTSYAPQGCVDVIKVDSNQKLYVAGWAYDQDHEDSHVSIHVYIDHKCIETIPANQERKDVNQAFNITGDHGFSAHIPTSEQGNHTITIKMLDLGSNQEYTITSKVVLLPGNEDTPASPAYSSKYIPQGCIDLIQSKEVGKIYVAGWAYDLDHSDTSIDIKVYLDDECIAILPANQERKDVNQAFNITGKHGFSEKITTEYSGSHTITIKMVDLGTKKEYPIGSQIIMIPYPAIDTDQILDQWINTYIDPSMSDQQKIQKIISYALEFPYNYDINNAPEMLAVGSGECWANTDLVIRLCDKLNIPASIRTRGNTLAYPDFHINSYILIDGISYFVDCGHVDRTRFEFEVTKGYSYTLKNDGTIKITDYDGYSENLEIPSMIDGKKVTEIGKEAFIYHFEMKSVVIPDTITTIEEGAFKQCTALEKITISPSVVSIGKDGFTTSSTTMLGNTKLWIKDGIVSKTIIGATNSTAEKYAKDHHYSFESNGMIEKPAVNYSTNYIPQGCMDVFKVDNEGKIYIAGWAFDLDEDTDSIDLKVYINQECIQTISANKLRADVNQAFHITGEHGFSEHIATTYTGNQSVTIKMVDLGSNKEYVLATKTLQLTKISESNIYSTKYIPQGCVDLIQSKEEGKMYVAGWAFDKDSINASIDIKVYLNSTCIGTLKANQIRNDVNQAFHITGNHGFSGTLPTTFTGNQTVTIKMVDLQTNHEHTIASKAITIQSANSIAPSPSISILEREYPV